MGRQRDYKARPSTAGERRWYFHTHFTVEKPGSRLARKPTRGHGLDKIWVQIPKQPVCLGDTHLPIMLGTLCSKGVNRTCYCPREQ